MGTLAGGLRFSPGTGGCLIKLAASIGRTSRCMAVSEDLML